MNYCKGSKVVHDLKKNNFFITGIKSWRASWQLSNDINTRCGPYFGTRFEGRSFSSAAPIETIQSIGERQNTRLSFSCRTNRHLRVQFDGISGRTLELEHLLWTGFIRCVWNLLCPIKAPFAKKILLFWSLHFLSAFFHKISSNVSRNMLKIQTDSYFHLTMLKWPISTPKLQDKEIFDGFGDFACNLKTTWRNSFSSTPQNRLFFVSFLQVRVCHSV